VHSDHSDNQFNTALAIGNAELYCCWPNLREYRGFSPEYSCTSIAVENDGWYEFPFVNIMDLVDKEDRSFIMKLMSLDE
jgi:hypothetical protein